ncbi:biorientation of chromosomes in cell division protein 1-like 1 [Oreochromis aureus]|uniref:BOD1/SHG1 domain-containing protein n=1 Tax=Oreochromis aureus TaxID=47969 RepID=A0AAZ1XDN5_OREAU|nr:biorientation of chromosomes in cell division protein 1-like 1 [Oreochromis aureus]
MAGLPPGDPQLVSMIVNHLKTQGLFDQFRRDCLADVDTKPAYLNLKQRVDNFVSNHLSNHTWSPHLNKNQLRNNIRQLVLQSGMLEQGVDRIVAQVVDPKINHIFRPQVERVVREFLSPGSCSEEPPAPLPSTEAKPDSIIPEQASTSTPTTTASDAMSILDTITSLNQEASVRASSAPEKARKSQAADDFMQVEDSEQDMSIVEEGDSHQEVKPLEEEEEAKLSAEVQALEVKTEETQEQVELGKEPLKEDVKIEEEEYVAQEQTEEEKDKTASKVSGKPSEEKQDDDLLKSTSKAKQKARERIKEEYSLEDSDLEGLSDITVSSVHTSDLSSFEGESEDEQQLSDSSEEGELPPDDEGEREEKKHSTGDTGDEDKERKPRRKAYVYKPFLYSRYYSDSDDEITVEERRRSAAKDKEERLLKRQQNRERMEEKRKQKAAQAEEQDHKKQKSSDSAALEGPGAKEARKERKVLEKKMALNRKRKLDSRKEGDVSIKKKGDTKDTVKKTEVKSATSKTPQHKLMKNLSEPSYSDERHRGTSGSISEDSSDTKKIADKGRTHSFILELEQGSQEALRQRSVGKFDRLSHKELHSKERKEKERSLSDERVKLKQKQEKKSEHQADESQQKEGSAVKVSSEEKGEKKPKIKSEKKITGSTKEGKVSENVSEEGGSKDPKKVKTTSVEAIKTEKDKNKDKDKIKEKEKAKGEKTSVKSDFKQLLRPDSAGSSEDRSDMEPESNSSKKKDKHSKEVMKKPKSHSEDRPGDKLKSKTDSKDSEKEKTKADQDGQKLNRSSSESDKDPKRVKSSEKGRILEKSKSKSKEEAKTPLLSKTEKRVHSPDVKSAGVSCISKPEATKEKKKEGNAKDQSKVSEESSQERSDSKSAKKKLEKKDKVSEKKDESQEEKAPREEKLEKSDKSPSVSSLSLEADEPLKKRPLLQDTSTDSDPVTTTVTTLFSDDTCDALSDITPEPPEGETESRLCEMPAVPAEADALLTLMDVCTSAEARLPPENTREDVTSEMELQDADMKMKEAALTLLSMDPDSTVSTSLLCQEAREESAVVPPAPQPMETTTAEEEQPPPMEVHTSAETESPAAETESPAAETESPAAETESPAAETESPAAETESPAAETESPAAETESPAARRVPSC